jgi:hypothetical protein
MHDKHHIESLDLIEQRLSQAAINSVAHGEMSKLVNHIRMSPISKGVFLWTSMYDLCIAQLPATKPYDSPYLRVSPQGVDKLKFEYIDSATSRDCWSRTVNATDAIARFDKFIVQLNWLVTINHNSHQPNC